MKAGLPKKPEGQVACNIYYQLVVEYLTDAIYRGPTDVYCNRGVREKRTSNAAICVSGRVSDELSSSLLFLTVVPGKGKP